MLPQNQRWTTQRGWTDLRVTKENENVSFISQKMVNYDNHGEWVN